jgi:hypothetical protein
MVLTKYQKYMISICCGLLASLMHIKLISKSSMHKLTKEEKDLLTRQYLKNDPICDNTGSVYRLVPIKVNKECIRRLIHQNIKKIDGNVFTNNEKKRIFSDIFSKVKYAGQIENKIIEILGNLLEDLGIRIVSSKKEEHKEEEKEEHKEEEKEEHKGEHKINIPNTDRSLLLNYRWYNESEEYSRSIWRDIHKNDNDSYKNDIFYDTKLLFDINSLEKVKEFGILVDSLIFILKNPKQILYYFDMRNIKDKKTRFVTLLTNKNTISYRYFNNLEENLSNYFIDKKKEKDEKITVGGRELSLIKHVYLCLRISIIDID